MVAWCTLWAVIQAIDLMGFIVNVISRKAHALHEAYGSGVDSGQYYDLYWLQL